MSKYPCWLFKSEPSCYSFTDLVRDKKSVWDGVTNAMARIHLRQVKKGDQILFYHTGNEKAIVGLMLASSNPKPDPKSGDEKSVVVEVKAMKAFTTPVTLAEIRDEPALADWDLVRNTRLSVMPITNSQWQRIEQLIVK